MTNFVEALGISPVELVIGVVFILTAIGITAAALRGSRQYADVPRGTFAPVGKLRTERASKEEPALRPERPEMSPAVGGFVYNGSTGDEATTSTLLDLATRGYLQLVSVTDRTTARRRIVVVRLDHADEEEQLFPDEQHLLDILDSGHIEAAAYTREHPLDQALYRSALEEVGLPVEGKAVARIQGISTSIVQEQAELVRDTVADAGWYNTARERLGTTGAWMIGAGGIGIIASLITLLISTAAWYWFAVSLIVGILGIVVLLGYRSLTPDGVAARDQIVGFRRYLVEAPRQMGANLATFVGYAPWARALGCIDEWESSLERLAAAENLTVADAAPWMISTTGDPQSWSELVRAINDVDVRLHSHPSADDFGKPASLDDEAAVVDEVTTRRVEGEAASS